MTRCGAPGLTSDELSRSAGWSISGTCAQSRKVGAESCGGPPREPGRHNGILRAAGVGLAAEPTMQAVKLESELVHLGGRRGHATRARAEVRVHGTSSADRDDAAQAMPVVAHAVTHGKHLVWRYRIPGSIEGTCGQTASLHGIGHT